MNNVAIPDNTASEYVYYVNEATQQPNQSTEKNLVNVLDGNGLVAATAPWTRKWRTSWSQSVAGCPVTYKIFVTRWMSDSTRLGSPSQSWKDLKATAMVDLTFMSESWYAPLGVNERDLVDQLRTA